MFLVGIAVFIRYQALSTHVWDRLLVHNLNMFCEENSVLKCLLTDNYRTSERRNECLVWVFMALYMSPKIVQSGIPHSAFSGTYQKSSFVDRSLISSQNRLSAEVLATIRESARELVGFVDGVILNG